MWLVESLVDERVVKTSMDEVDAEVGEYEEERKLEVVVVWIRFVHKAIVEFRVTTDFGEEEGDSEDGYPRHGSYGLSDFHADLVLEEFGVLENCFVEDQNVGE